VLFVWSECLLVLLGSAATGRWYSWCS